MLLIVRYPSASSALNMLSALRFQLIHPLRNASVKDFCFSFLKSLGEDPKCADVEIMAKHLPDTSKHYLVHVFNDKTEQANRLVESIREFSGDDLIEFSGVMQARAGAYSNGSRFRPFPILADGIIVYAFGSEKQMSEFVENPKLLSLCEKSYDFMLAEFDRQI